MGLFWGRILIEFPRNLVEAKDPKRPSNQSHSAPIQYNTDPVKRKTSKWAIFKVRNPFVQIDIVCYGYKTHLCTLVRIHSLDKKRICTKFAHRKYVEKIYKMISKDDKCYICIPSYHGVVISRQIWYLPSLPLSYSSNCILQLANSLFIAIPVTYLHNKSCSSKLRRMQSA